MNVPEIKPLLEKLTGQASQLPCEDLQIELFRSRDGALGYSQLNELLLLLGFDRISRAFFRYLLDGELDYHPGLAFDNPEQLKQGIDRFCRLAILLYGNIKFAFKSLSTDSNLLQADLERFSPLDKSHYTLRHSPILPLQPIEPEDAYLTGYLIEAELRKRLANNPDDSEARALEELRLQIVKRALANQHAYLASDHLDVYVATSMRERHEFVTIGQITRMIFHEPAIANLKLRWFDPTQAYCVNRIDKGLSEGLMLRRASCTIYLAQETDTLGKDSELASTLAQGKPVVAFLPDVTEQYFRSHLEIVGKSSIGRSREQLLLDQLRVYSPELAWTDPDVRAWCESPHQAVLSVLEGKLMSSMKTHYDKRAKTLCESHPLGIQVNLDTGVANGVLVVRNVRDCALLIRNILLHELEFELEETDPFILLRERISKCVFRVVTKDVMLTNTFWNFYLQPAY